jgi:hypothetical protein
MREVRSAGRTSLRRCGCRASKAQRDHHVRLTAAHRLGQFEDSLIRLAGQTQQTFAEKLIHAVGDEVAREELAAVARVIDEVCEVLDPWLIR